MSPNDVTVIKPSVRLTSFLQKIYKENKDKSSFQVYFSHTRTQFYNKLKFDLHFLPDITNKKINPKKVGFFSSL